MRRFHPIPVLISALFAAAPGCSSDSTSAGPQPATQPEGGSHAVDPFNGDCSTARWADVSEACWSCACSKCKDTLDACNEDCMSVLDCTFKNHTLVNKSADIGCEIRATLLECLKDPKSQSVASPLTTFDGCLINATKPAGQFRACEVECGIPYSGDVCQRYPAPPAAHGG